MYRSLGNNVMFLCYCTLKKFEYNLKVYTYKIHKKIEELLINFLLNKFQVCYLW